MSLRVEEEDDDSDEDDDDDVLFAGAMAAGRDSMPMPFRYSRYDLRSSMTSLTFGSTACHLSSISYDHFSPPNHSLHILLPLKVRRFGGISGGYFLFKSCFSNRYLFILFVVVFGNSSFLIVKRMILL